MTPAKTRGAKFREDVLSEFEMGDPAYGLLLDEIAAVIDEIDRLAAGAVTERRQQRTLLSRLLGQLALPGDDSGRPAIPSGKSIRGRAAAEARWRRHAPTA